MRTVVLDRPERSIDVEHGDALAEYLDRVAAPRWEVLTPSDLHVVGHRPRSLLRSSVEQRNCNLHTIRCVASIVRDGTAPTRRPYRKETELFQVSSEPIVAIFYTIWSYAPGAGRTLIFDAVKHIKENKPEIQRYVTLSPKTEVAKRFHLRNGAVVFRENGDTVNYEYHRVIL